MIKQNTTPHNRLAWIVTITTSLFFFYEFIQMNLFNAINSELRTAFHLDAVELGQLFSMYFYANFLCLFPAGNILDRLSTRKVLLFAISICTIGTYLFSTTSDYYVAAAGRFLVGAGASFCFLSCIRIASRWFPPHKMAFVTGVIVTMAMLGGLVAQTPFEMLSRYLGDWHQALYFNTALGVVILIVTFFIVRDRPPGAELTAIQDQAHLQQLGLWKCIKLAALNPQNWLGGLYTSLMNLPVFVLGGLWGILYITRVHHISEEQASYATTMFFVGVIVGSLAFGWISDHMEKRITPMVIGAILSLIVMLILMFAGDLSLTTLIVLFFMIGLVTSSQVLTYPTIAELNPSYLTSTAVSIDSLCIMASGFIAPPLFGYLMQSGHPHALTHEAIRYTAQDFKYAMWMMPISFIIALGLTFFMKETNCKSQVA